MVFSYQCSARFQHVSLDWAVCSACGNAHCSFLSETVKVTGAMLKKDHLQDSVYSEVVYSTLCCVVCEVSWSA